MKIGLTGSSLNNRDFLSGSAVPILGLINELKKSHQVFWLERNPDPLVFAISPVPVISLSRLNLSRLPRKLKLDVLLIQAWCPYPRLLAKYFKQYGTKTIYWDDNTPYAMRQLKKAIDFIDLILTHGDGARKIIKNNFLSVPPVEIFYFAADPERFRPEKDESFAADVVFVGTNMPRERTPQLKWLFFEI